MGVTRRADGGIGEVTGATVQNALTVSPRGGDFVTLKKALEAVADPGPTNRWLIEVGPGVYLEDNPLPGKQYTYVVGSGTNTTRITATNTDQDLFNSATAFIIGNLTLAGVSGTGWVVDITAAHDMSVENVFLLNCVNGFRLNHASGNLTVDGSLTFALTPMTCAFCNNAGMLTIRGRGIGPGSTITTVFDLDGASGTTIIRNFISTQSGVTTVLAMDNGARSGLVGCSFDSMVDGVVLQGGASVNITASSIVLAQQDAIRIEDVGSVTRLIMHAMLVAVSGRYDLNVLSATAIVSGVGSVAFDQLNIAGGATISLGLIDLKEGDEGFNVLGELHVGMPELPTESVFGGGDSYTRGMLVYTYNPSGAVWTDVSTEAQSASGSAFTFPAVAQDNAVYVASFLQATDYLQHYGVKIDTTVAAVLGAGSVVVEYWNGSSWVEINHMTTLADAPYTQYAKDIFERTGSEQVRYPIAFLASWAKNDLMGYGTNLYWIRFRVATAITTVPVFEQFKLHTSRFEINLDGATERYGNARHTGDLPVSLAQSFSLVGSAPSDKNIAFSATQTLAFLRNGFNNPLRDGFGVLAVIPEGMDTSIPLNIRVGWYADTTNAGDIELEVDAAQLELGDLLDGSESVVNTAMVETVGASTRYVARVTVLPVDVSELVPGEALSLSVFRDARVGNGDDTLNGNIVIFSLRAVATLWEP